MRLSENPIFLTQKRLAHRAGVWAPTLLAGLVGMSLLAGLLAQVTDPTAQRTRELPDTGKIYYGCALAIEAIVLVLGGFAKIARALADDRKAGLWDSNRLTPLAPSRIVLGYWLGSALRECYMAAAFAAIGFVIVVMSKLPLSLWLGTQIVVVATALFFGLVAAVIGMAFERPQNALAWLLPVIVLDLFSFQNPRYNLLQFLLPVYGAANWFFDSRPQVAHRFGWGWDVWPELFAVPVPPFVLSLGLQLILGLLLWRAAVRKTASPSHPLLLRWEAVTVFALFVFVQHALVWGIWHGRYPGRIGEYRFHAETGAWELALTHGGTLLLGALFVGIGSPLPERVRVEALRGGRALRLVFGRSALVMAVLLAALGAVALLPHFILTFRQYGAVWALASANLLIFLVSFCLVLELSRVRFRQGPLGVVALGLFVLWGLPLILAGLFSSEPMAELSVLTPGFLALLEPALAEFRNLMTWTMVHLGLVTVLFLAWWRQWRRFLAGAEGAPPAQ